MTEVFVHDIGENPDKKVGALNYGFGLIGNADYLLGVDGDTTLAPDAVAKLEAEIVSDSRIGGISAIYTIDDTGFKGLVKPFLIAGQRAQFAAFNMQNMLRGRNMAVLGGQCSIFSMKALRDVMKANHQADPVGQRLRGRGLPAVAADQVRRLPDQDQRAGSGRRWAA